MYYKAISAKYNIPLDVPVKNLKKNQLDIFLYGTKGEKIAIARPESIGGGTYNYAFEGVINNLERRYNDTTSESAKAELENYMSEVECPECHGKRLKPEYLAVTVGDMNISQLTEMSVSDCLEFL